MSINWFVMCKDCKVFSDIAQGYEGEVRATETSDNIVSFLYQHRGHSLKFVSEHAEDDLEDCIEVT